MDMNNCFMRKALYFQPCNCFICGSDWSRQIVALRSGLKVSFVIWLNGSWIRWAIGYMDYTRHRPQAGHLGVKWPHTTHSHTVSLSTFAYYETTALSTLISICFLLLPLNNVFLQYCWRSIDKGHGGPMPTAFMPLHECLGVFAYVFMLHVPINVCPHKHVQMF